MDLTWGEGSVELAILIWDALALSDGLYPREVILGVSRLLQVTLDFVGRHVEERKYELRRKVGGRIDEEKKESEMR